MGTAVRRIGLALPAYPCCAAIAPLSIADLERECTMIVGRRQILIGGAAAAVVVTGAAWVGLHGMGSMTDYDASAAASRATLAANPDLQELVRFATLAPSGHNTQPWRFRIERDRIDLLPDFFFIYPLLYDFYH